MNYQKKGSLMIILNYMIGSLLLLCLFFSQFKGTTYFAIIIFAIYMCVLLWKKTEIYIKYLLQVFGCFAVIISMILIEIGEYYVSERQLMGVFTGSIPLLIFSYWVFFEALRYFDAKYDKRTFKNNQKIFSIDSFFSKDNSSRTIKWLKIITVISNFLLVYMFICVMKNPSFLLGLDRGEYAQMFTYSFLYSKINSWSNILLVPCILSVIYGNKKLGLTGVVFYFLHSFWVGQKFGSFMSVLNMFLILIYPKIRIQKEMIKKIAIKGLFSILILVGFSAFAFSFTSEMGVDKFFATRMAGQGAMWWGTYSISDGTPHIDQVANEIEGFLFGEISTDNNVGAKYGIYNIMYLCSPSGKVDYDLRNNARYTEAGFASAYYILGPIGPIIFAIFCAFLFSVVVNSILKFLNKGKFLEGALVIRIYYLVVAVMCMFTFNQFRSLTFLASLLFVLAMRNVRLRSRQR